MADDTKLNCWPGCFAIVCSKQHPAENGRLVRVLRRTEEDDYVKSYDWQPSGEPAWIIEPVHGPFQLPYNEPFHLLPCRDSSLIPLPPKMESRIAELFQTATT